jgi:hypothetical protein
VKNRIRLGTSGLGLALLLACSCSGEADHASTASGTSAASPIDIVQSDHHSATAMSVTATFPNGPPHAGNVIVAVLGVEDASDPVVDVPSGYTPAFTLTRGGVYWKVSNGTETSVTVRIEGTTDRNLSLSGYEVSGVDVAMPIGAHGDGIFSATVTSAIASTETPTTRSDGYAIAEVYTNGTNGGNVAASDGFEVVDSSTRRITAEKPLLLPHMASTTFGWSTPRAGSWVIVTLNARSA